MAFPTVQSRTTGASSAAATTHTVTLPATINSGDFLFVAFTCGNASAPTVTWDDTTAGTWTSIVTAVQGVGNVRGSLYSKVADGTEGSAALSIGLSASAQASWTIWRITGCQGAVETISAAGTSATVTFSALAPTWGAEDTLWMAIAHIANTPTVTTYSTGYTNATRAAGTETGRNTTESVELLLNASSETPSAWTLSGPQIHVQFTVAIRPAAGASGLTITSVTPSSFDSGIAGIVIAGSGFGASQGSSTVDIGGQAQTVTAWSDTSITITSARGSNSMGAGQLKVTIR